MNLQPRPCLESDLKTRPTIEAPRYVIEDVYPTVDGGDFPIKRIAGEAIEVWADVFRDGHEVTLATLLWRRKQDTEWRREPMMHFGNDRWTGRFTPTEPGRYAFAIEAWTDGYGTWRRDFLLKQQAGQPVDLEAREGRSLLDSVRSRRKAVREALAAATAGFDQGDGPSALLTDELAAAMHEAQPRPDLARSREFPVTIDRERARASAWYELFPRSETTSADRHGTFADVIARVPSIAALGYDVLYFPPIHPIGRINRKGRNNALTAEANDVGSPYAIGAKEGGHDALHPELGGLEEFRRLVRVCADHGMEIALDFATQCAPDHPWVTQRPDWFKRRPDGSIKYAENPPKKYQDIHNPDFYGADGGALWSAFRDVIQFWVDQGVRIFRVDNPHTKPFPFWRWLIEDIQSRDPGVIFLAEAFTRPKVMKALAKLGFTQSYTYFTWRTTKAEFTDYLSELTRHPEREFYRPNFFVNTPDILPAHLQTGEPWMFKSRVALAATLSGNYGVYSGFELLEHEVLAPGKEEYLDSEKYEIRVRDWTKPGNISEYIGALNRLRRENQALLQTADIRFAAVDDDYVIGFVKESPKNDNAVAVAIALANTGPREFWFHFGDIEIGPPTARRKVASVENLWTGERRALEWGGLRMWIDPSTNPTLLYRCFT